MGVKIRLRGKQKYFYLDICLNGKRRFEALHFALPADRQGQREAWALAEEIRRKRELQIAAGRYQLVDPVGSKMTLIKYAEKIAAEYDKKMHLPKSLKYLRQYAGDTALVDVDERFIDAYRAFLLKQEGLGAKTAQHYLAALKAVLARAERERLIERNPAKGVKPIRAPEHEKPYLTVEEIQRLYNTPVEGELADEVRRGFLLSCFTGLRLGDIRSLLWGDIRREPEPMIKKRQNKTGDIVSIPLAPIAWELIDDKRLHRQDELVFPRLTATKGVNPHQPLIAWRKRAGIEKAFGWHAGRHSFAMMTLEASGDIYAVSRLLGHSDIKITEVYLRMTDQRKKEIIASLPQVKKDSERIIKLTAEKK